MSFALGRRRRGDLAADSEIWQALDEGKKLIPVLEMFYSRVYEDPKLAPFFEGVTKQRAIEKQFSFMHSLLTGQRSYFGERPRNAHHWMVISEELFDYREALLERCCREVGLDEKCIQKWLAIDEVFRAQIVKDAPIPKKIRGVELPLEGYAEMTFDVGGLCDGCESEIEIGDTAHYHRRTGKTYCEACKPAEIRHSA